MVQVLTPQDFSVPVTWKHPAQNLFRTEFSVMGMYINSSIEDRYQLLVSAVRESFGMVSQGLQFHSAWRIETQIFTVIAFLSYAVFE
jgi:hypothetical protein